jgi:glycosyltransferase involved in cell wall biosynthesis
MDISAVVLSFNSMRYIETCIRSLVQSYAECGLEGEILVVENGSVDGSVAILGSLQAEFGERLKVIYQPENTGTTRSRNMALRIARGRSVLILDSDAYMNSAALRGMLAYQRANPRVGLVAPRLTPPESSS